jgi:hypothetical protein
MRIVVEDDTRHDMLDEPVCVTDKRLTQTFNNLIIKDGALREDPDIGAIKPSLEIIQGHNILNRHRLVHSLMHNEALFVRNASWLLEINAFENGFDLLPYVLQTPAYCGMLSKMLETIRQFSPDLYWKHQGTVKDFHAMHKSIVKKDKDAYETNALRYFGIYCDNVLGLSRKAE